MSDGEVDRSRVCLDGGWRYDTGRNVIELHFGRMLRAMYDAQPVRPPSRVLDAALRSLDPKARGTDLETFSKR